MSSQSLPGVLPIGITADDVIATVARRQFVEPLALKQEFPRTAAVRNGQLICAYLWIYVERRPALPLARALGFHKATILRWARDVKADIEAGIQCAKRLDALIQACANRAIDRHLTQRDSLTAVAGGVQ